MQEALSSRGRLIGFYRTKSLARVTIIGYSSNRESAYVYTADDQTLELTASTETYTWNSIITRVDDAVFAIEAPYDNFYFYRIGCYTLK